MTTRPDATQQEAAASPVMPMTGLYVPADRLDRIAKALAGTADVVIVDLEDAVHPGAKDAARVGLTSQLAELLATAGRTGDGAVQVRVNPQGTRWHDDDLQAVATLPAGVGVRVPKVEDPATVATVRELLPSHAVHALIETPLGVERALEIAGSGITSLGLGEADLVSALCVENAEMLSWQRSRVLNAAAAAGLAPPWMSVYPKFRDLKGLRTSCEAGRRAGFLGRSAVHPAQLPAIRDAFRPDPEHVARAARILGAMRSAEDAGAGVWVLEDGSFVDAAMVGWARRIQSIAQDLQHTD